MPAMPPPMTRTSLFTDTFLISNGLRWWARSTAPRMRSIALAVAASLSSWTQLHCSRMLAISRKYGLSPAEFTLRLKVSRCIRGEQAATTILLSLCFLMSSFIICCPGLLQTYSYTCAILTPSNSAAVSFTFSTSTVPLIFPSLPHPHLQMYTPIRDSSRVIFLSSFGNLFSHLPYSRQQTLLYFLLYKLY